MIKRLCYISILIIGFPLRVYAALADGLPTEIKDALNDAHKTKNNYVIESVIKYTKQQYPAYDKLIDSYIVDLKKPAVVVAKVKQPKPQKKPFSGSVDVGLNISNGNTQKEDINLSSQLRYEKEEWTNTLKFVTRSSQKDKERINEEYIINNQTDYKLSDKDYAFLELEYVNDRFGGYQYRTSELVGYGYNIYDNDKFKLAGEASVGARQALLTDESTENSLLGKVTLKSAWSITDATKLTQSLSSSFGADAIITTLDSGLKTQIMDSIYLKFNHNVQHVDTVPVGTKNTDVITSFGVGYEF